jgi:hypothetical protein
MTLKQIQSRPTYVDNVHESVYRSYNILVYVLQMIQRGDSKETIFEVVEFLNEYPIETEVVSRTNNTN